jgi:hypothetical protein
MHIGTVCSNMASRSNLKGVNERSRLLVGAIISAWRRWIDSPPCRAIRPRCHLPLDEDARARRTRPQSLAHECKPVASFQRFLIATARFSSRP